MIVKINHIRMKLKQALPILAFIFLCVPLISQESGYYKNFVVSVYARAYEVREMSDLKKLEDTWNTIAQQLKVDKIYLETHRDKIIVDDKTLEAAKKFFTSRGVKVAGGITYTMDERNHFETFCYSNPEHRQKAKEIAEYTAKHFDEFILDDFFFTSCKCDLCIKAKGNQSWTQYRLNLMKDAARDLIINPAKAINPNVKIVVKYPNWYEHFQGLGFNLEAEPAMFDGIYTGTETRDPVHSGQHLQQYESYLIFRYFEHLKPGKNGGGWVDPGGMVYMDRYAEQLWLTLFAKSPEITLFDYRQLLSSLKPTARAEWQGNQTSFDWDEMIKPIGLKGGKTVTPTTIARAAGYTFEKVDKFIDKLGNPIGIKSYRPYHSFGEDFLQNYIGMIGIPMDIVPEFPMDDKMILLTESAKFDPKLADKIKSRLIAGKNVMITSGLLHALQGKGIEDIVELRYTDRKALVKDFMVNYSVCQSNEPILIPQIDFLTNDSWMDISSFAGPNGWPILHQASYSKGNLFVLTIPENYADLYNLPEQVLNRIRSVISPDLNIRIDAPSQVSLFVYNNGSFIVESFLPKEITVKIITVKNTLKIQDILSNEEITGISSKGERIWGRETSDNNSFEIKLKPHSFRVFRTL
jgi:hypothetical protein